MQQKLDEFDRLSKSKVGIHMFRFYYPIVNDDNDNGDNNDVNNNKKKNDVYISSEVTDDNNVLDVRYTLWEKQLKQKPNGDDDYQPTHVFSNGRIALAAVLALLNDGYEFEELTK